MWREEKWLIASILYRVEVSTPQRTANIPLDFFASQPKGKTWKDLSIKKAKQKRGKKFYACPQAMIYAVRKSVCYHWLMWFSWHNFFLSQLFNLFKQTFQLSTCVEKYHIFIKLQKMLCNSMKKVSRRPIEI
jgi:hypothetical protein